MRLRRYETSEVESAVKQARTELGEDAMLVSVERAKAAKGGTGRYRVIFAAESVIHCEKGPFPGNIFPFQNGSIASKRDGSKWNLVRSELSELAGQLSRTLSLDVHANTAGLFVPISGHSGLNGETIQASAHHQTVPPMIEVLVGPYKSGKSTAAAKLASNQANSGRKVALVHLFQSEQRLEPQLALKGVIECSAESITHLDMIVDVEPLIESILVDASGNAGKMTDAFISWLAERRAGVHLTLDAHLKSEDWLAGGIKFRSFLPTHLLLTHVDQVTDWAAVWRGIGGTGLPCSYFSAGPHLSSQLEFIGLAKSTQVESVKAASA